MKNRAAIAREQSYELRKESIRLVAESALLVIETVCLAALAASTLREVSDD